MPLLAAPQGDGGLGDELLSHITLWYGPSSLQLPPALNPDVHVFSLSF